MLSTNIASGQETRAERVTWLPGAPPAGGLAVLQVEAPGAVLVIGAFAGQPLHFERTGSETFAALAGVPISSDTALRLTYEIRDETGGWRRRSLPMPVLPVQFGIESLRVDPRFSARPDSALAARIREESRAASAVYRRSHETPRLWEGPFRRPLASRITSPFGMGREFNGELRSRHLGTDFDGNVGDPIRAVNRGVVALVGDFYYGDNVVYIDHGRGLVTAYLHMSDVLVARGDSVSTGAIIGRVGATGRVTGPHLHLIVRYGTLAVNGEDLLRLDVSRFPHAGASP